MRMVMLFLTAAAGLAAPAAAAGRDWPLTGFERVQLEAAADVAIRTGPRFAIHADGAPDIVRRLGAEVRGGTLFLNWVEKPPRFHDGDKLHISITLPKFSGGALRGVGSIEVDRAEAPEVVFAIDGTGSIDVAAVKAARTVLALKGTGSIEVAGTTRHLDARRSGVGSIDAAKLAATSATLVSSGVGSLSARVDGPVTIEKSGLGSVEVAGAPRCTVKKSGMGSVDCGKG